MTALAATRTEAAPVDTRCRYCWAVITKGDPATAPVTVFKVYFHVECPPEVTPFPVIGSIDARGELIRDVPDDPYTRLRQERRR